MREEWSRWVAVGGVPTCGMIEAEVEGQLRDVSELEVRAVGGKDARFREEVCGGVGREAAKKWRSIVGVSLSWNV